MNQTSPEGICIDCAKEQELRNFILFQTEQGVCGYCQTSSQNVSAKQRLPELANLIKALVRYYYDESSYNRHWGGDDIEHLLMSEDIIFDPHRCCSIDDETFIFIREKLIEPAYPDEDKGVWIYAGFDDGIRLMQNAMINQPSSFYSDLRYKTHMQNHHDLEEDVISWLRGIDDRLSRTIDKGDIFWRSRIGYKDRYIKTSGGLDHTLHYQPFHADSIMPPPPPLASAGRINRPNVSYLYLSTDEDTAIAEVRPHPGHQVSTIQFQTTTTLKVIDFGTAKLSQFSSSDRELNKYHSILDFNRSFSTPVTPEEKGKYLITQLVADCIRRLGYQGISFSSSVGSGENLCLFSPSNASTIDQSASVKTIKSLHYTHENQNSVLNPDDSFYKLK
ncbi:MAG: RES family NAD+ phosphorylase [Thalassospira sp.]|uniref:RES family NAD+ phosphorylase n=1 Tax=Thalassospira sp. TaxID=1912094 RepID=UPI001B11BEB8|nr:RES family NAD+ phosphorylase [Thalassospira sp.]MBO6578664.1 RES family NAD+ phosphorylase [Thalassospira sp.]MBO6887948.1 RES family NAD+ phosphorylase [Thalassospira sp.]